MTRFVLLALAALLVTPVWAARPGACPQPRSQAEFPQLLGPAFERRETTDYESDVAGGGCSVRYQHTGGMWADVYVYSAGLGEIKDAPRDPKMLELFKGYLGSIVSAWKEKRQAEVLDIQAQYETHGKVQKVEAMSAWARIVPAGAPALRTHILMWTGKGVIWKLRVTFPEAEREVDDAATMMLGDALVDLSREAP